MKIKKTSRLITIDTDVHLWAALNVDNFSAEVNNYFRARMQAQTENPTEAEREALEGELNELKTMHIEISKKQALIMQKIQQINEEKAAKEKQLGDEAEKELEAIKRSGIIEFYAR